MNNTGTFPRTERREFLETKGPPRTTHNKNRPRPIILKFPITKTEREKEKLPDFFKDPIQRLGNQSSTGLRKSKSEGGETTEKTPLKF